eukprot:TRINITY_DN44861_c0_g1_i1.p1 TRINITY_DN44861_c0_g1~~TRINITY_DN44861_c0_g1_i1.p1  ORF type:complete len:342 (+),score=79.98 TRINITY_DN44861_c0_g1_i1:92-1117(+)
MLRSLVGSEMCIRDRGTTPPEDDCIHSRIICAEPVSPFQPPFTPKFGGVSTLVILLVCLAGGVCTIVFDSEVVVAIVASTVFWTTFYLLLVNALIDHVDGLRFKCGDGSTRGELLVSVFHQLGVCLIAMVVMLAVHVNHDFKDWWNKGPVYAYSFERQVQVSILGYELKDLSYGCIHWTWLVHHGITFIGVLMVLNMPAGLGLVSLNGLIAELGSGFFNLRYIWENLLTRYLYFVGMFLSNGVVVAFTVLLWWVDDMAIGWKIGYSIISGLLFALRTEGLRREVAEFYCPEEKCHTPAERDISGTEDEVSGGGNKQGAGANKVAVDEVNAIRPVVLSLIHI